MDGMNGSLDGIISELTDLLGRAEWSQQQAQEALDKANAEVKRIKAMLKAANPEPPKEEPKPKAPAKPSQVNDDTRRIVIAAIHAYVESGQQVLERVPHSFTVSALEPFASPLHSSSVRTAVSNLRDVGIIRACGLVPNSPRKAPMAYVMGAGNEHSE